MGFTLVLQKLTNTNNLFEFVLDVLIHFLTKINLFLKQNKFEENSR